MQKYKFSQFNIVIDQDENYATIYNCYNSGIIKLENEILEQIKKGDFILENIRFGAQLLENGYIVNCNINEFQRVKTRLEEVIQDHKQDMLSYVIAPTLNCNLRCVYCFQKDFRTDGVSGIVTYEMLEKIKRFILSKCNEKSTLKRVKITWFGGEPLLCFDQIVWFCQQLKQELKKRSVKFESNMITNGVLLDESKLQILIADCNMDHIQITVDGEEDTYCAKKQASPKVFQKVLENICNATKYVKVTVRVNADKSNFEELRRLIDLLYQKDINPQNLTVHFAQLRDYSNNNGVSGAYFNDFEYWEYKKLFYKSLNKNLSIEKKTHLPSFSLTPYCGVARCDNMVIDYLGNLYKCEHYIGDESKVVGNINEGLYYNEAYKKSFELAVDERCFHCNIFPCCNYAQCVAMHAFAGSEHICRCYEDQLKTIISKVKKYLEEK